MELANGSDLRLSVAASLWSLFVIAVAMAVGAVAGAVSFAGVPIVVGPVVAVSGLLAAVSDVRYRRIPDRIVVGTAAAAAVLAVWVELLDHVRPATGMLAGAVVAAGPLLLVHLIVPAGVGFGDVKYAAALGGVLGIVGWGAAATMVFVACLLTLVGAVVRPGWRTSAPFGACLAAGALLAVVATGRSF